MSQLKPLLFATTNPGKAREAVGILRPYGYEVVTLDSLSKNVPEPVEDAATFSGNARLKALGYAAATGMACLAEDSGLVVDALGGAPGVHSARYAGRGSSRPEKDAFNNEKLLGALSGVPESKRTARFVSAVCLCSAEGEVEAETEGRFEGSIALEAQGAGGFGYDPLFLVAGTGGLTSAQLSPEEKNRRSHRGAALRALAERL